MSAFFDLDTTREIELEDPFVISELKSLIKVFDNLKEQNIKLNDEFNERNKLVLQLQFHNKELKNILQKFLELDDSFKNYGDTKIYKSLKEAATIRANKAIEKTVDLSK